MRGSGGGPRHSGGGIPASEYYGSMAAGSIVGASRSDSGGSVRSDAQRPRPARGEGKVRATSRREQRMPRTPRPEHLCRSSLVAHGESRAEVPTVCLGAGGLPLLSAGSACSLSAEHTRTVFLVLTTNALTIYETASRRQRLATYPLRKLCSVEPLPRQSDAVGAATGLAAGFHADLDATQRPPALPLPQVPGRQFRYAALFFSRAEAQIKWLALLRQASDPKPPRQLHQAHMPGARIDQAAAIPPPASTQKAGNGLPVATKPWLPSNYEINRIKQLSNLSLPAAPVATSSAPPVLPKFGLTWEPLGSTQPESGRELTNRALADGLMSKTEFTRGEFEGFGHASLASGPGSIDRRHLRADDFIKVGHSYYKPVVPMVSLDYEDSDDHVAALAASTAAVVIGD
jgi:hypothetical protein